MNPWEGMYQAQKRLAESFMDLADAYLGALQEYERADLGEQEEYMVRELMEDIERMGVQGIIDEGGR